MHDPMLFGVVCLGVLWFFVRAFLLFTIVALKHTLAVHEATVFGWGRG